MLNILALLTPTTFTFRNPSFKLRSSDRTSFMCRGSLGGIPNSGIPSARGFTQAWALETMHALSSALHGLMKETF